MKKPGFLLAAIGAVALVVHEPAQSAGEYEVISVTNGGSIDATVVFKGNAPKDAKIKVSKNPEVCGTEVPKEDLMVGVGGALQNAVVYLSDITKGKKGEPTGMTIANSHCQFQPRVQAGVAGGKLNITNEDAVLHNTHIFLVDKARRTVFNKGLPNKGMSISDDRALQRDGLYNVKCDAHSFMSGWIVTMKHPYVMATGSDGKAKISDIPPGEYNAVVWHESLGAKQQKVKIESGKALSLNVEFSK